MATDWVEVSVADTGPGIPSEEANRIFDKFYQVTPGEKPESRGNGPGSDDYKSLGGNARGKNLAGK